MAGSYEIQNRWNLERGLPGASQGSNCTCSSVLASMDSLMSQMQLMPASPMPGNVPTQVPGIAPEGGSENVGFSAWWEEVKVEQADFVQRTLEGYVEMKGGLEGFLNTGNKVIDDLNKNMLKMGKSLLGNLTGKGGPLSFLGTAFGAVQSAMSFISPVTSVLSAGFSIFKGIKGLFGSKKKKIGSPLVNKSDYVPPKDNSSSTSNRTVNVYINGQSLSSAVEVDRTLGRAGIDRKLRDQVKELVRSGADPTVP